MSKIENTLEDLAKKSQEKEFNVLIVHENETDMDELHLGKFNRLMCNIVSTTLTGRKIIELSEYEKIKSIERDTEVNIADEAEGQ